MQDARLIPELERPPGEGNANLLQNSCLGNPKDRGAWRAHKSRTQLSDILNNSISHDLIKNIVQILCYLLGNDVAMSTALLISYLLFARKWCHSVMSDSATPWTVACQAPMSMGLSRQDSWSGIFLSFSRGSSQLRDQTWVSRIAARLFTIWATRESLFAKRPSYLQRRVFPESPSSLQCFLIQWPGNFRSQDKRNTK